MSSLLPPENRPRPGSVLEDRYRLVGELGEGGIGWVYRAEHLKLGHQVAIKMLQTQFVGHDQMRPRFEREAKALAALSHPNIVTLTDYSVSDGRPYLVMELLEGSPLSFRIDRGPMSEAEAKPIIRQILEALAYAHQRGFVHRDLKPDNVFLVREPVDFVKVLDFGFVKLVDPSPEDDSMNVQLTRSGSVFGTPAYMSPEQVAADRTDPTTDVYSLGIMIFEMLAGQRPFVGENPDVLRAHLTADLPKLCAYDLEATPELIAFLAKATAKKRAGRFPTAEEMLTALDEIPSPWMVPARPTSVAASPTAPTEYAAAAARPKRSSSLGLGAMMITLIVLAGVAIAVFVDRTPVADGAEGSAGRDGGTESDSPTATTMGRAADIQAIVERLPVATGVAGSFGPSPWTTLPPEPSLDEARARVVAGFALDDRTEQAMRDWARSHHGDARPHLVLGEHFYLKRFRNDAIERLNLGQRLAEDARNDPRMLAILLELSTDPELTNTVGNVIANQYGAAARTAVEAELDRPGLGPIAATRLRTLLRRLH